MHLNKLHTALVIVPKVLIVNHVIRLLGYTFYLLDYI